MEQKLSTKKIQQALEEMKEISRMEFLLFSPKGKYVAGTTNIPEKRLADSVAFFADSPAESQVVQDWIFFRVEIEEQTEYIMLTTRLSNAIGDDPYIIGRMAVCQIRNMLLSVQEPLDQTVFLRQVLNGELSEEKIEEKNYQLHMKNGRFMIYVIQFQKEKDAMVVEMIRNLFVVNHVDYLIEMDDAKVVLIKNVMNIDTEYNRYAQILVDNIQSEAMTNVWVGFSKPVDSFKKMSTTYREASTALLIGRRFYGEDHAFDYYYLGVGRLVYQLSEEMCEIFLREVLGDSAEVEFDEETLTTINILFDNDLNISETARRLFIHRNTLVYRLERIEKRLGLDIRAFEDAMLFKIAMMTRLHLKELRKQNK